MNRKELCRGDEVIPFLPCKRAEQAMINTYPPNPGFKVFDYQEPRS